MKFVRSGFAVAVLLFGTSAFARDLSDLAPTPSIVVPVTQAEAAASAEDFSRIPAPAVAVRSAQNSTEDSAALATTSVVPESGVPQS